MSNFYLRREYRGPILVLCEPNDGQSHLVRLLAGIESRAFFAHRPREAFEILAREEIQLVISAVHLEESDAYEFLTQVKADSRWQAIPFVFICLPGTQVARHINHTLELAANALGATKYLSLEDQSLTFIQDEIASFLRAPEPLNLSRVPLII